MPCVFEPTYQNSPFNSQAMLNAGEVPAWRAEDDNALINELYTGERLKPQAMKRPGRPPPQAGNARPNFFGDTEQFSDSDFLTAERGGIASITIRKSQVPRERHEVTIKGRLLDTISNRKSKAPNFNKRSGIAVYRASELGLGKRFEWSHLWGPGFGDEAAAGLMLAPKEMNQQWQNRGIEDFLRSIHAASREFGGEVHLTATATSWDTTQTEWRPRVCGSEVNVPFLKQVTYDFSLVNGGLVTGRLCLTIEIGEPPSETVYVAPGDLHSSGTLSI